MIRAIYGSQRCDLFTNRKIFVLNHVCSKLRHSCSKSHHFCFDYKMSVKALLLPLFIKPTPRSITFGTAWILWFQKGCNMVLIDTELCVVQFWSDLWFQIELALRPPPIFKSRIWFQTKLHSRPVQLPLFITSNIHNLSGGSFSFKDGSLNHTLSKTPPNSLRVSIQTISIFFYKDKTDTIVKSSCLTCYNLRLRPR